MNDDVSRLKQKVNMILTRPRNRPTGQNVVYVVYVLKWQLVRV